MSSSTATQTCAAEIADDYLNQGVHGPELTEEVMDLDEGWKVRVEGTDSDGNTAIHDAREYGDASLAVALDGQVLDVAGPDGIGESGLRYRVL